MKRALAFVMILVAAACVGSPPPQIDPGQPRLQRGLPPALKDSAGWGVHVLALERAPDGAFWAGTYGLGMFVLRPDTLVWERIAPRAGDSTSLSWSFVNSIAFARGGAIWYGTVGNGFGRSTDGGRTWRNWTIRQLGPEWQYVAPDGIATLGDTVYIATADGLRITWDGGQRWRCVVSSTPSAQSGDCAERIPGLPTEYLLSLDVSREAIYVGHLQGMSISKDGGVTWVHLDSANGGIPRERVRAVTVDADTLSAQLWAATETDIYVDSTMKGTFKKAAIRLPGWPRLPGGPRAIIPAPGLLPPLIALSLGMAVGDEGGYRIYYLSAGERYRPAADLWTAALWGPPWWPVGGSAAGLDRVLGGEASFDIPAQAAFAPAPAAPRRTWLGRPIANDANPFIDGTYRYGSTMGGGFQQHQGIEFNNPAGTPVHAVADGVVAFAGLAEQGSNTVAILHDMTAAGQRVFTTYYHNSALEVTVGQRVRRGDVIARVGSTGRATNEHLHLEVHVTPTDDVSVVVNPEERFPPHTVNPQLWIEPMPGTGVVAGRVVDSSGNPVRGARVYGLVITYPEETPFSFAETYGDRAHSDPDYGEHFAVGDVAPGEYLLGVEIEGRRVWRRLRVMAGQVTFVEFSP